MIITTVSADTVMSPSDDPDRRTRWRGKAPMSTTVLSASYVELVSPASIHGLKILIVKSFCPAFINNGSTFIFPVPVYPP